MTDTQTLFRPKEAAKYLRLGLSTFQRYVQQGIIGKGISYSPRCTVFKKETLDKFIEEREQATLKG